MAESVEGPIRSNIDVVEFDDRDELIGETTSVAYDQSGPADVGDSGSGNVPADHRAQQLSAYLHALDVLAAALRAGESKAAAATLRLARAIDLGTAAGLSPGIRDAALQVSCASSVNLLEAVDALRAEVHHCLLSDTVRPVDHEPGFSVLIVNDDPIQARLLEAVLRNTDREVTAVPSVQAARETVGREGIDLVIVDRMLEDGDGHDLLVEIRSQAAYSNIPVIVISASASEADVSEAYALGADAYFSKDTSPKILAAAVSAHLARAAMRKQAVLRDPDTGVRTRTVFLEAFEHQAHLSMRRGAPFTLAAVHIDRFRRLIDLHGTEAGRRAAGAVSEVLKKETRASDILGRWSPEVFVVAFPDTDVGGGQIALSKLWDTFAKLRVPLPEGSEATITASGGIAGLWEAAGDGGFITRWRYSTNRTCSSPTRRSVPSLIGPITTTGTPAGSSTSRTRTRRPTESRLPSILLRTSARPPV